MLALHTTDGANTLLIIVAAYKVAPLTLAVCPQMITLLLAGNADSAFIIMITNISADAAHPINEGVNTIHSAVDTSSVKPDMSADLRAGCTFSVNKIMLAHSLTDCTYIILPVMVTDFSAYATFVLVPDMITFKSANSTSAVLVIMLNNKSAIGTNSVCIMVCVIAGSGYIHKGKGIVAVISKCKGYLSALGNIEFVTLITQYLCIIKHSESYIITLISVCHIEELVILCLDGYVAVCCKLCSQRTVFKLIRTDVIDIFTGTVILTINKSEEIINRLGFLAD